MFKLFGLLILIFANSSWGQDISIPTNYVQQNQHTAFFFGGENSLISHCSLSVHDMDCLFLFEDDSGNKTQLRVPYERLSSSHSSLLSALKKLRDSWVTKYPFSGVKSIIFLTRADDFVALEQMIIELEKEPLPLRVLQLKKDTRSENNYIYSGKRAREIFAVFQKHLNQKVRRSF